MRYHIIQGRAQQHGEGTNFFLVVREHQSYTKKNNLCSLRFLFFVFATAAALHCTVSAPAPHHTTAPHRTASSPTRTHLLIFPPFLFGLAFIDEKPAILALPDFSSTTFFVLTEEPEEDENPAILAPPAVS